MRASSIAIMQETFHFCYGNEVCLFVCLLFFFCNKTFDLVCFLHFSGVIALYYIINKAGFSTVFEVGVAFI